MKKISRHLFALTALLFALPSMAKHTLVFSYDLFHSGYEYGEATLYINELGTRFDIKVTDQVDSSEVVKLNEPVSYFVDHRRKLAMGLDEDNVLGTFKQNMNWNGTDEEFKRFMLQQKISEIPAFKDTGVLYHSDEDPSSEMRVKPYVNTINPITEKEKQLIKKVVSQRFVKPVPPIGGGLAFYHLDILAVLNQQGIYAIDEYHADTFGQMFKLKSFERVPQLTEVFDIPNEYNKQVHKL